MNINLSRVVIVILVAITFGVAARAVLRDWRAVGLYPVTGDEPRNLIVARSIFVDHTVDVTRAVQHELQAKEFFSVYPDGSTGIHSYRNGMFTPHGLAVPAYIALPLGYLGKEGARYAMTAIAVVVAGAAAWLAMFYAGSPLIAFAAAAATTVAMPFIPAAGQFYPDIPGGAICLLALVRLIDRRGQAITAGDVLFQVLIATLPWWHLRFTVTALILVAATLLLRPRNTRSIVLTCAPLVISLAFYAAYNKYAFDNAAGPYGRGMMEVSMTSAMVLVGLFIDQNQGLLFQNPVFLVGIFFFPAFIRSDWRLGLTVLVIFASLLVPNALHINWYGGGVISGRFQWAATTVLIIPTIFGLTRIARASELWFTTIVVFGVGIQVWYHSLYASTKVVLFNRDAATAFQDYSIFFPKIRYYLPALYDARWAYGFLPNYAFAIALILLLGLGVRYAFRPTRS
jgi:hypothetical protein